MTGTPAARPPRSLLALAGALGLAFGLAGCEVPRAQVDPQGRLAVLAPGPGFSAENPRRDWDIAGEDGKDGARFETTDHMGVPALRVATGRETSILFRHTRTILPVSPYLSWAWNMGPFEGTQHPIRIVVGFHGGDPASGSWGSQPLAWTGSDLPPYDRLLTLVWDVSALRRGHLGEPRGNPKAPRLYTVRGGIENLGHWHLETVDLDAIYRKAWPDDDSGKAQVMFIGIAALGGPAPSVADISGLVLSR